MSLDSEVLINGGYNVTWDSVALGLMEGDEGVPIITPIPRSIPIARSHRYGYTKINSIHMGVDHIMEFILMEYTKAQTDGTAGSAPILWPFAATWGLLGTIGKLKYSLCQSLVLTAISGTTAASTPASLTASKAVLSDDHQPRIVFGPQLRTVPMKLDLYHYDTAPTAKTWGAFTET